MSSIFLWIAGALLAVTVLVLVRIFSKLRKKAKAEADPEDNYPLW